MSALGTVGESIAQLAGSTGNYSLTDLVKNQPIQSGIDSAISQYNSTTANDSTDLNTFIKNYLAGNRAATKDTAQETSAIDRYYNGDVDQALSNLRANQLQLGNQAVNFGIASNRGNVNRSLVSGGGGGDNSYDNRIGINTGANLNLANETAVNNQARADYNQVLQGQLGLVGQRTNLANALAGRALVPAQTGQAMLGSEISNLTGIENANNNNNMFGAKYNPTTLESVGSLIGGLGAAYSQFEGYGGGGTGSNGQAYPSSVSPSSSQMTAFGSGAGPVSNAGAGAADTSLSNGLDLGVGTDASAGAGASAY